MASVKLNAGQLHNAFTFVGQTDNNLLVSQTIITQFDNDREKTLMQE